MKKIFTFLFFAGLMTSAIAQQGRNGQRGNPDNRHTSQSTVYSDGGPALRNDGNQPGYQQNNGYQQEDRSRSGDYNNGYGNNDRRYQNRYHDNGYRNNNRRAQYDQRAYGYNKGRGFERNTGGGISASISIIFGKPGCF